MYALSGIEERVQATPTPLKDKDASSKQSVEGQEAKWPSMATPAIEDPQGPHPWRVAQAEFCFYCQLHHVILCYTGRVPTHWWPHRVLGALWTWRPIVKVAVGCRTEPAIVHFAYILQKLHSFFQFSNFLIFFYNLHSRFARKKN